MGFGEEFEEVAQVFNSGVVENLTKGLKLSGSSNGFLQYMVRTIAGTLVQIGQGRIRPDQIPEIFEARDRRLAGPSLPAHGLHLIHVEY